MKEKSVRLPSKFVKNSDINFKSEEYSLKTGTNRQPTIKVQSLCSETSSSDGYDLPTAPHLGQANRVNALAKDGSLEELSRRSRTLYLDHEANEKGSKLSHIAKKKMKRNLSDFSQLVDSSISKLNKGK